jgi:excisionase family DNA binding protein
MNAAERDRISLHEAARRLGVHYMTVYRYVRTGRLPAERDGAQWAADPADLDRMRAPGPVRDSVRSEGSAKLVARMVAGDEAGAWNTVETALASSLEPADVYLDLLVPALRDIGAGWSNGTVSVADEHGALDLGANVPTASFLDAARDANRLVAVMIAVTTPGKDRAVRASARALRAGGITVPILVGGGAIENDAHTRRVSADGWSGQNARSAVEAAEDAARRAAMGRR